MNKKVFFSVLIVLIIAAIAAVIFLAKRANETPATAPEKQSADIQDKTESVQADKTSGVSAQVNAAKTSSAETKIISVSADIATSSSVNANAGEMLKVFGYVKADENESPIPKAEITAVEMGDFRERIIGETAGIAISDLKGYYELLIPLGKNYLIIAKAEGYSASQDFIFPMRLRGTKEAEINFNLSPGVTISGVVKDKTDKPVPDALVSPFYMPQRDRAPQGPPDQGGPDNNNRGDRNNRGNRGNRGGFGGFGGMQRMMPPSILAVKTNENGEFTLSGLSEGIYSLSVIKEGYVPTVKENVPAPSKDVIIIVEEGEGGSIEGHIFYADNGKPAEGAKISVRSFPFTPQPVEVLSKDDGSFEIKNLIPANFEISATKEQMKSMPHPSIDLTKEPHAKDVVIKLFAGYSISGHVYASENSSPIPGVTVTALEGFGGFMGMMGGRGGAQGGRGQGGPGGGLFGTTDDAGFYSITGIFTDRVMVIAQKEGLFQIGDATQQTSGAFIDVKMPADRSKVENIDISMMSGVKIAGIVKEKKSGTGIAGARVRFNTDAGMTAMMGSMGNNIETSADGTFSGYVVVNSKLVITASHDDYSDASTNPITVGKDGVSDIVIEMTGGGTVTGIVVAPDDQPVAGARVTARSQVASVGNNRPRTGNESAETDESGRYKIEKVPAGEVSVNASSDEYPSGKSVTAIVQDDSEVEAPKIMLGTPMTIEGTVKYESGENAADADVRANGDRGQRGGGAVKTDAEGKFKIEKLAEGKYTITAQYGVLRSEGVQVDAGATGVELVLDRGVATVFGKVVDGTSKQPVPKYTISYRGGGFGRPGGGFGGGSLNVDNPDGAFEIQNVRRGTKATFTIEAEGYVATNSPEVDIPLEGEPAEVTFEIGTGGSILGTVKISGINEMAAGAKVVRTASGNTAASFQNREKITFTNSDGAFLFSNESPGTYKVKVTFEEYPESSVEAKVVSGSVTDLGTITLKSGGIISGFVYTTRNNPQPFPQKLVELRSLNLASEIVMTAKTGADGSFMFDNLPKGEYNIKPSGGDFQVQKVNLKSNKSLVLQFYPNQ